MRTDDCERAKAAALGRNAGSARLLALAAAFLVAGGSDASAMTIKKVEGGEAGVETILLEGKIEDGDALALQGYIAKLPVGAKIVAHLNSTGGLVPEGIATGRVIYKNKVRTVIPSKAS
jgi:hypothetical protein